MARKTGHSFFKSVSSSNHKTTPLMPAKSDRELADQYGTDERDEAAAASDDAERAAERAAGR